MTWARRCSATLGVVLLTGACMHSGPKDLGVQALPPDHVPPDLYHDSVMVPSKASRVSRAVIMVEFDPETPVSGRREAIEAVDGRVVGGIRLGIEGYYLVWVPHDDSLEAVDEAIRVLGGRPGVWMAMHVHALEPAVPP